MLSRLLFLYQRISVSYSSVPFGLVLAELWAVTRERKSYAIQIMWSILENAAASQIFMALIITDRAQRKDWLEITPFLFTALHLTETYVYPSCSAVVNIIQAPSAVNLRLIFLMPCSHSKNILLNVCYQPFLNLFVFISLNYSYPRYTFISPYSLHLNPCINL